MYLERLQMTGADITNNPNKYFKPNGEFNTASPTSDIQMPNCTQYGMLASNEMCDATSRMIGIAIKDSTGFHNAKYWYQETGMPKGSELREGSIAVFDGNSGHVAIVATKIDDTHATITHSQYDSNKSLRNYKYWQRIDNQELVVGKATIQGVGKLIGFIYLPINDIRVARDTTKNQIAVNERLINVRKGPSLKEEKYDGRFCPKGIYNVLNFAESDGYTWYKLESKHWIAGVDGVVFYEAEPVPPVWVKPEPVPQDTNVDQVYINNDRGSVRIRRSPSLNGDVMDYVDNFAYYNTFNFVDTDMRWYNIGIDAYVAGIPEVVYIPAHQPSPWEEPIPVDRDTTKDQIKVSKESINIRREPTTDSEAMSTCRNNSYYNVFGTEKTSSYTWYKIGDEAYVANVSGIDYLESYELPVPVEEDKNKDQLYVGDVLLNIRKEPSTSAKKMGMCEPNSNYDVFGITTGNGFTWYKLGNSSWVAGVDEVTYYPKGSSRIVPELKKEIPLLQDSLDVALKCINRGEASEFYDELYAKVKDLKEFINSNFDPFEYDLVDPNEYDEIDLLYTADVHGAWVGYDEDGNYLDPVFNYDDISSYRNKLMNKNIKALLVDCGDWSRPCRVYTDYVNTGRMISAEQMNEKNYFVSTYGNHEWKWGDNEETISILNKSNSITACNLFKNGKLVYKPYRTAKIGSKKIAVIGIGYPSPNGSGSYDDGVWTYGDYTFLDDNKLFAEVQKHINTLKENNFDYIVIATHMCKSTYESDNRYIARTDTLIQNTKGLTAVLQGHYNFATNAEEISDKGGRSVLLAHESGANMNSFGRLQLRPGKVTSYLLDERSDLDVI